ncbi:MAG: M48 family metallopeptidase [Pirellulales bacterium]|nr:M48 family metallopeptidase [Pirellulales bacterium]
MSDQELHPDPPTVPEQFGTSPDAPVLSTAPMTERELDEAKRYGHISLACDLCDRIIDITYLAIAAFVLAGPIDAWLARSEWLAGPNSYGRLALLIVVIYLLHMAVSLPLTFFSGHVIEHRFGLSNQSVGRWIRKYALRHTLGLALAVVLYIALFWIIWHMGSWWWIIAAVAFFGVGMLLSQLAPVLIMPLFYKVTRLEDDDALRNRFAQLADGTGLAIEGVYRLGLSDETSKANAMLAGLGRTRRVLLGDTLLDKFSPEELDVILAHEIGHHVHRHIVKLLLIGALVSFVGFWLCDRLLVAATGTNDYVQIPTTALPLVMLALTVFTMVLEPLQNAISRFFERQSDRYAMERTGDAEAYRGAFQKLARQNKADPNPHPLEVFLFHSHPPIAERIKAVDHCYLQSTEVEY